MTEWGWSAWERWSSCRGFWLLFRKIWRRSLICPNFWGRLSRQLSFPMFTSIIQTLIPFRSSQNSRAEMGRAWTLIWHCQTNPFASLRGKGLTFPSSLPSEIPKRPRGVDRTTWLWIGTRWREVARKRTKSKPEESQAGVGGLSPEFLFVAKAKRKLNQGRSSASERIE